LLYYTYQINVTHSKLEQPLTSPEHFSPHFYCFNIYCPLAVGWLPDWPAGYRTNVICIS
jgi:hypothetical protein